MSAFEQALESAPERMTVTNLVTQETREAQFNPTEWEAKLGTVWQRFTVMGLSHQPKHFVNTENLTTPFELFYRAVTRQQIKEIRDAMNFFQALVYPIATDSISAGGVPRVLFRWPNVAAIVSTVNSLSLRMQMFTAKGHVRVLRIMLELEEIRSQSMTSDDARQNGLLRAQGNGPKTFNPFE